jgi:sigma-54 specific flagellar transcriptional regulator A
MPTNSSKTTQDLIVGNSEAIHQLRSVIPTYAASDASVLIRGKTGTGKELISIALHQCSNRENNAFYAINCAAIPGQFLESELFGHKKGSFTGSVADRKGKFELCHEGTLFLDEIGDMPLDLQSKLLRVLEDGVVQPLGGGEIKVDVRIIAATHQNLEEMISKGTFREDLFYRINVLPITVPSLSERMDDIPVLIQHFAALFAKDTAPIRFTDDSLKILLSYTWPGNVRELSNFVKRFSILMPGQIIDLLDISPQFLNTEINLVIAEDNYHDMPLKLTAVNDANDSIKKAESIDQESTTNIDDVIDIDDFEDIIRLSETPKNIPAEGIQTKEILQRLEERFIEKALTQTKGNVSKASKLLNLGRTSLIQKIDKYKLSSE